MTTASFFTPATLDHSYFFLLPSSQTPFLTAPFKTLSILQVPYSSKLLSGRNATSSMKPSSSSVPWEPTSPVFEGCSVLPMALRFLVGRDGVDSSFLCPPSVYPRPAQCWHGEGLLVGGLTESVDFLPLGLMPHGLSPGSGLPPVGGAGPVSWKEHGIQMRTTWAAPFCHFSDHGLARQCTLPTDLL